MAINWEKRLHVAHPPILMTLALRTGKLQGVYDAGVCLVKSKRLAIERRLSSGEPNLRLSALPRALTP